MPFIQSRTLLGGPMIGRVAGVNAARGMVAVLTERGDYSIFEMLGDDPPEVGDEIRWDDDTPLGGETIHNITQHIEYDVFFQNHHVSKSSLRVQLLLR